ncbi:uncharacterized protein [Montipora capricornis]|uniref:uncharacterized protein n=1 Tax=Montipora capricornis TaxID=246305 RepID=UPI0035F108DF
MQAVWQCLKNVVLPGYSSCRNTTLKGKAKGAGCLDSSRIEEVGNSIKEAINTIAHQGNVRKLCGTFIIPKIKPSGCSCGESIAIASNDLALYIIKSQPRMVGMTGAAIRNCIYHCLKGCNGRQATFNNGKRNASHISRSLFDEETLKKLDEVDGAETNPQDTENKVDYDSQVEDTGISSSQMETSEMYDNPGADAQVTYPQQEADVEYPDSDAQVAFTQDEAVVENPNADAQATYPQEEADVEYPRRSSKRTSRLLDAWNHGQHLEGKRQRKQTRR